MQHHISSKFLEHQNNSSEIISLIQSNIFFKAVQLNEVCAIINSSNIKHFFVQQLFV
jgi:hypothetical protein